MFQDLSKLLVRLHTKPLITSTLTPCIHIAVRDQEEAEQVNEKLLAGQRTLTTETLVDGLLHIDWAHIQDTHLRGKVCGPLRIMKCIGQFKL
eukprot:4114765-Ditylum_brightwellii.AAC.1